MRWGLCIAVAALCFLTPNASAKGTPTKPAHAHAHRALLLPRGKGFSWTPSSTEPYAVCGRPSARHPECSAIVVPNLAPSTSAGSSGQTAPAVVADPTEKAIKEDGNDGPYSPTGLREAYDLPSETAGSGQTVGIVDAYDDPDAESDLAKYRSHFGLFPCTTANGCFRKVNGSGGSAYPPPERLWAAEISLDLDMVSAVCPKCHILLVEARSNGYLELAEADNEAVALGATELNDSWGGPEFSNETKYDSYFDHPGVPITVAGGDTGGVITYPAATPYVISVGGTALERAKNLRGWTEHVWGGEGVEGTGSGCSAYEPKPAWQTDTGCAKRTDNDVAASAGTATPVWVADSYEDLHETYPGEDPGWTLVGGTSAASAIMSATMALASEYTKSLPGAEALYEQAAQNGTGVLDDVLSGHDGACGTYLCEAIPGYDGPTGLGSPWGAPVVLPAGQGPTLQQEPQGSWVGKVGSAGYLLAGWDGVQDASDMPNVTASLVQGSRFQWAQDTTDVRALQSPDGLSRNTSAYDDPNQIQLRLSFNEAYSGNLHLYAADFDSLGRRETISVNGQSVALSSSFNQGAWLSFPISVGAGGTVIITATRTGGPNAVFSGIFLGEGGAPPAATPTSAPQGSWVGKVGSEGYDLAGWDGPTGDVSYLKSTLLSSLPSVSLSLGQGSRYQWAQTTTDQRALSDPGGSARNAGAYYDPNQIQLKLKFLKKYEGNLHLYALDWDSRGRREIISVNGQSAVLSSDFTNGAWISFPISVAENETVTITVDRTAGPNAVLSGLFLGEAGTPPGPTVASAPQGAWVKAVGARGYDLAGWDGSQGDVSDLPGASLSLVQGSRYQWAAASSDPRALSDPSGLTRNAGAYYDPNEIRLKLSFPEKFLGNLHLYAVDWDHYGRRETVTVNGQSVALGELGEGAWVSFPLEVAAGGTVTITVDRTAGPNAVLSGIFLGGEGAPPTIESTSAPQGSWVNAVGSAGYDLTGWNGTNGDVSYLPNASLTLQQASRWQWAQNTTDPRALSDPGAYTRNAGTYYDSNQIQMQLSFKTAYSGKLHLYAVDWDSLGRREVITVNGQSAVLASDFTNGAWVSFPISVEAGGTVAITVTRTAGPNAVLSGIFLGEGGAPPGPTVSGAPQGSWVNAVGSAGYDLAAWNETSDLTELPNATLAVEQASRYTWAASSEDPRALERPDGLAREAATYYDPNEIKLKLTFPAAYSGNLHLYAVDWDSLGRREIISVNGQSAALSSDFTNGAWVSFPISVEAGGTVTIAVDRTAGPNAVLSGIFLG